MDPDQLYLPLSGTFKICQTAVSERFSGTNSNFPRTLYDTFPKLPEVSLKSPPVNEIAILPLGVADVTLRTPWLLHQAVRAVRWHTWWFHQRP